MNELREVGPSFEPGPKAEVRKPITFFFLSGLGAADHGLQPIKEALQAIDKGTSTEAVVWNSVFSSDPPTPRRWAKMAV